MIVPVFIIGGVIGRIIGKICVDLGPDTTGEMYSWVDPGVFALIGAGACLTGTLSGAPVLKPFLRLHTCSFHAVLSKHFPGVFFLAHTLTLRIVFTLMRLCFINVYRRLTVSIAVYRRSHQADCLHYCFDDGNVGQHQLRQSMLTATWDSLNSLAQHVLTRCAVHGAPSWCTFMMVYLHL